VETMTARVLRERLVARGIRQQEFAREAGMDQPALSCILRGRQYLGAARQARIERAIEHFGLNREVEVKGEGEDAGPVFRVRQL
jgi:transcriptional regulator with XRE-family HTH domain